MSDIDGRPAYRPSGSPPWSRTSSRRPARIASGSWRGAGRGAARCRRPRRDRMAAADGRVVVRAPDEEALATARFMLALDDDTGGFHERFGRDPLIGPSARAFVGYRPLRLATVTHAVVRALCGQLDRSPPRPRDRARDRPGLRRDGRHAACAPPPRSGRATSPRARPAPGNCPRPPRGDRRPRAPARPSRTTTSPPASRASAASARGRSASISIEGLGRFDRGLVGDLSLVKLHAALTGRWVDGHETAELLAPYEDWQGLAGEILLLGWSRGLVRGASADRARIARRRERRAA